MASGGGVHALSKRMIPSSALMIRVRHGVRKGPADELGRLAKCLGNIFFSRKSSKWGVPRSKAAACHAAIPLVAPPERRWKAANKKHNQSEHRHRPGRRRREMVRMFIARER